MTDTCRCPACGSELRLEVVRMTKPQGEQLTIEQARPREVGAPGGMAAARRARAGGQRSASFAARMVAREIAERVAAEEGMTLLGLVGRSREARVVRARQRAMWEAREAGATYGAIGQALDRDHSTVHHGVRAHAARLAA